MRGLTLLMFFLAACGPKQEIQLSSPASATARSGQSGPDGGAPEESGARSQLQIACEADSPLVGIFLPNSLQATGTRVKDFIEPLGKSLSAPMVLGMGNRFLKLLFLEGKNVVVADYSFRDSKEVGASRQVLLSGYVSPQSQIYGELGFSVPRFSAVAPDRQHFLLRASTGYELRRVWDPLRVVSVWKIPKNLVNPRWEGVDESSEIFFDRVEKGTITQAWLPIFPKGLVGKVAGMPRLKIPGHQLGLRKFDAKHLMWMEWSSKKILLRFWDMKSAETVDHEIPEGGFGPGYALYSPVAGGKLIVLQGSMGLWFFAMENGRLVFKKSISYPRVVQDSMERNLHSWRPGAIFSGAGDSQLFAVLPHTWGRLLFAVDEGLYFRQLGHESCLNPDFFREF